MLGKGLRYFILFSAIQGLCSNVAAQEHVAKIDVQVLDQDSLALSNVNIVLRPDLQFKTDSEGKSAFVVPYGTYQMKVKLPQYEEQTIALLVDRDRVIPIILQSNFITLQEAVFTAKEGTGLSSKSEINQQAMMHLQPSSFSDLMELTPGGLATDPKLTSTNSITLRESSDRPSSYQSSALGVQFMVDDNIINSNADFQRPVDKSDTSINTTYQSGVDMRSISTNDIEKVEIIRGIPTASYGDLTSGLIKIERRIGQSPLQARVKVDGFSKQFYLGKGFRLKDNWSLNASFDYLKAKDDPSDETTNYDRITASLRSKVDTHLFGNTLQWRTNLDYTGTMDQNKVDPDNGYASIDRSSTKNRKVSIANNFIYHLNPSNFFNQINLNTAVQQGFNRIEVTKLVQYSGPRTLSTATETGENIGFFPALSFESNSYTDGKPLDIQAKLETKGKRTAGSVKFDYDLGLDWRYSKNNGEGEVYDILQPPSPTLTTRPRQFKSIPGTQILALYGGNQLSYKVNHHGFNLYTGFRLSSMLGMDSSYKIAGKVFVEPRVNFQYNLPKFKVGSHPLHIDLTMGYGEFYKQPTNLNLYPAKQYKDYSQLSYYGNDPQYRYVNFMTYVTDLANKDLTAAKNIKKEIRLDLEYRKHHLSVTYFQEDMKNGFRNVNQYNIHSYKKYDASQVSTSQWGPNGPDLTQVPYTPVQTFSSYSFIDNGSVTDKEGIEFQYSSPRISSINTRFTLSGAWFHTKYENSIPMYNLPTVSIGGATGGFPYVGIYANDTGYENEKLNYNLMIDTYVPSLDLTFSASLQGTLFTKNYSLAKAAAPFAYMDLQGNVYDFTEADKSDPYKQWLVNATSVTDTMSKKTSYDINVNLKVTKSIYKSVRASMFVNRLFNYTHPYTFNGLTVSTKSSTSPYFGMEINYNF